MIFYLTGTGNSRWAAQLLADHLHDTAENAAPFLKSGLNPSFHSDLPWVFVCPTYGWQIPHIFADLLRRTGFDGSRQASCRAARHPYRPAEKRHHQPLFLPLLHQKQALLHHRRLHGLRTLRQNVLYQLHRDAAG